MSHKGAKYEIYCDLYCNNITVYDIQYMIYCISYTLYQYKIYTVYFNNTMQKYRDTNDFSNAFINLNFTFELLNSKTIELYLASYDMYHIKLYELKCSDLVLRWHRNVIPRFRKIIGRKLSRLVIYTSQILNHRLFLRFLKDEPRTKKLWLFTVHFWLNQKFTAFGQSWRSMESMDHDMDHSGQKGRFKRLTVNGNVSNS